MRILRRKDFLFSDSQEKGAPSCFSSVSSLFSDEKKSAAAEKIIFADLKSLRANQSFDGEKFFQCFCQNLIYLLFKRMH